MPAAPHSPKPEDLLGTVIGDRFAIESVLGAGGMAYVYRAQDRESGTTVAIKLLKDAIADNVEAAERLRREGELLTRFAHPAVVGIEYVGRLPDGRIYLAMEFLEGQTLGQLMRAERRLPAHTITPILAGAVAGLSVAHAAGVVHRDLKPDNIFLQELPGGETQVKLLDFGVSMIVGHERLTRTGQVLGTPRYMAPEQLAADKDLDARIDTYALGVILYEALSGNPPFLGTSPSELVQAILHGRVTPIGNYVNDLPEGLDIVVHRAMARAKDARYESARSLCDAWLEAMGDQPMPIPGPNPSDMTDMLGSIGTLPDDAPGVVDSVPPASFSDFSADGTPLAAAEGAAEMLEAQAGLQGAGAGRDVAGADAIVTARPKHRARSASPDARNSRRTARPDPARQRRNRALFLGLLVLALCGGVCTAGLAVMGMRALRGNQEAPNPGAPPSVQSAPAATSTPSAPRGADPEAGASRREPGGVDVPTAAPTPPDDFSAPSPPTPPAPVPSAPGASAARRDRGRSSSMRSRAAEENAPVVAPWEGEARDTPANGSNESGSLYQQALAAQRSGDARGCVSLITQALHAGGSRLYYRTQGECYERLGESLNALKAYERFCLAAPRTNPARARVQARVLSMHGRCD